ncbi:hypothetical protein BJV82DRAFT_91700 [Fennellomyces sp. T-0311]|nr:hypothetical protein BJV82DRAFT_91700 [Fennellomyces sp. T-0311]
MGANTSKATAGVDATHSTHHAHQKIKDLVDLGSVLPNGLYSTALQDYDLRCVRNLIVARKLAPFYKGLSDAPHPVLPNNKLLTPPVPVASASMSTVSSASKRNITSRPRSASSSSCNHNTASSQPPPPPPTERQLRIERMRLREKMLYNDAIECPICFLYYPSNINYSRCCDQPICTECFVQIKRPPESQTTPATCPFCMQENFGVIYTPPSWSESLKSSDSTAPAGSSQGSPRHTTSGISNDARPRRQTISHQSPGVVLVDHVRPHWNRAPAATTRSSRSNSSAAQLRTVPTAPGMYSTRQGRSASSAATSEYNQFLSNMRDMDMDLEEWMVMEAIRRSLAEPSEPRSTTHAAQSPPVSQDSIDEDDDEPLYNTALRLEQQQQQQDSSSSSSESESSFPTPDAENHNLFDRPTEEDKATTTTTNRHHDNSNDNTVF